ncbi:MAG TPA: hypothetical protein VE197_12650 [Mycobacterium sp.]|nr:hypothetical protein [Mycobacterium sp.]
MTELRVVVPDETAKRLAEEAADEGSSAEEVAAKVLTLHTKETARALPSWVGALHSGRGDLSEHHEEILKSELGRSG